MLIGKESNYFEINMYTGLTLELGSVQKKKQATKLLCIHKEVAGIIADFNEIFFLPFFHFYASVLVLTSQTITCAIGIYAIRLDMMHNHAWLWHIDEKKK